ncbi:MAG: hypothetical protein IKM85_04800 [Bacteroidales bacterium]|nr:hypothetical protein [Bacteroidales bacterium]
MADKEQIINAKDTIPVINLVNYIKKGVITLIDLQAVGLSLTRLEQVEHLLDEFEASDWGEAERIDEVAGYQKYLACHPNGKHAEEARAKLGEKEDAFWAAVSQKPTKEGLEEYSKAFPQGEHIAECKMLLDDLPYLEVKRKDTIQAYKDFMAKYPGRHTEEILMRIEEIEDENDWRTACSNNTREAYRVYVEKHKERKRLKDHRHEQEAKDKINHRSGQEIFIENLKNDPNYYSAGEIQKEVENGTATWEDLRAVFSDLKIAAIQSWSMAEELPTVSDMQKLPTGFAEVFFWGTKGTGKTCVIGSVLGSLNNIENNYIPIQSPSELHRQRLTNLFSGKDNICTLPDSTITTNLPAMTFRIRDEKRRQHQIMLIDMAGEAFTGIFKARNNIAMTDDEKTAVEKIENYLMGKQRNSIIHFFVVEYGSALKVVDPVTLPGITQINILQNVAAYFQEKGIFQKSTVGVYVIVTKCDKISCAREERAKKANDYLSKGQMGGFINLLQNEYAKRARVADFKKIAFSIGDVFAKNLCVFDNQDTRKIIEKLLLKTPWVTGDKLWEKILGWLRYH